MSFKAPSDDSFVNVWIEKQDSVSEKRFYDSWLKQSSAKHQRPPLIGLEMLRKQYPNHSIVLTGDYRLDLFNFPAAQLTPIQNNPLITHLRFLSLGNVGPTPGVLVDDIEVGTFDVVWKGLNFILHRVLYPLGSGLYSQNYLLHNGPEENIRSLLLDAGIWADKLHNEIFVYEGYWRKDANLWAEIQKADWKDVILKDDFKKSLQKDVYSFFDSEELYKDLGIPWKRGLIMHGPPGNGKTISLKAIMKWCDAKGFTPLYVKTLPNEYAMTQVFSKARLLSPCIIVLEDLDSLINDGNRSFFLNQLDGLEGNDGLLIVATTNHFDRLDPGLSSRPSRFDRKFLFDDPDREGRALYAKYWQNKLSDKDTVDFPDSLIDEIAEATPKFSFAYLKEAFVSSLVVLAGIEDEEKPSFKSVIMDQIDQLKKQLDKPSVNGQSAKRSALVPSGTGDSPSNGPRKDIRRFFSGSSGTHAVPNDTGRYFVQAHSGSSSGGRFYQQSDYRTLLDHSDDPSDAALPIINARIPGQYDFSS